MSKFVNSSAAAAVVPSITRSDDDSVTVLVVDDDPFVRELNGAKLRANGCRVLETASGDDALPLLRCGGIDVLVTDICMPGTLDGWSLAEQARLIHPQIVVVYASSRPADGARQVSGSLYVQKPCRGDAIIAAIRRLAL